MHQSPSDIMESLKQAKTMMAPLHGRASRSGTIRRIEELMQIAAEYDEALTGQLARTSTRIYLASS